MAAKKKLRRRVCVDLPENLYFEIKIMAQAGKTSMSGYLRMAAEDAIERRDVYSEDVTRKVVSTRKKTVEIMPQKEFDEICRQLESEAEKKNKKELKPNGKEETQNKIKEI